MTDDFLGRIGDELAERVTRTIKDYDRAVTEYRTSKNGLWPGREIGSLEEAGRVVNREEKLRIYRQLYDCVQDTSLGDQAVLKRLLALLAASLFPARPLDKGQALAEATHEIRRQAAAGTAADVLRNILPLIFPPTDVEPEPLAASATACEDVPF